VKDQSLDPVRPCDCDSGDVSIDQAAAASGSTLRRSSAPWRDATAADFRGNLIETLRILWREGVRLDWIDGASDREFIRFVALGWHVSQLDPERYDAAGVFVRAWRGRDDRPPHKTWRFISQAAEDFARDELRRARNQARGKYDEHVEQLGETMRAQA